ncbi:MAG: glycosyltransferase 87 family protein [Polyangiales bacterium]
MPSARAALLSFAWLASVALVHVAAAQPAGERVAPYLAAHLAMTASMLAAWRWLRAPADLALVTLAGVLGRLALIPVASFTTTDVARYLWDGAVALEGLDPYAIAPASDALAGLRARFPSPVDHHDVATCYPPLALGLFALAAATGPARAWWSWKALTALASCATSVLAWRHLRGERARDAALVAWSPILVLEAGVGAHLDAFSALAVAAFVVCYERRNRAGAALAAGFAGAVKLVPGVVLLALLGRTERPLRVVAIAALPVVVSFGVAEVLGMTPPGSLPHVAATWSFAAPLWTALYALWPLEDDAIRAALGLGGVALAALIALRRGPFARNARDVAGVALAASPVLYPWYAMPAAALAGFAPSRWALAVGAVAPVSYEVLDAWQRDGRWAPARYPVALIALVALVALAADLRAWLRDEG